MSCSRRESPDRDVASRRNRIVKHIRRRGTFVVSDGNMAWRSLCAKHNVRNEEVAQQVKEFTRPLPVQHHQKNVDAGGHAECWWQLESLESLPTEKEVAHGSNHEVPQSLHTKSMHGLGEKAWDTWMLSLFWATWPKFGEGAASLPRFRREEKIW